MRTLAMSLVVVLLLVGCGGGATTEEGPSRGNPTATLSPSPPSQQTGGEGTYTVNVSPGGATIDATIYAPAGNDLVARVERFRAKFDQLDSARIGYLLAEMDNAEGSSRIRVSSFEVITDDGDLVEFVPIGALIKRWRQQVDPYDTDTFDEGRGLMDLFAGRAEVAPGDTSTQVFAAVDPPSISEVWVNGNFDTQQMFLR